MDKSFIALIIASTVLLASLAGIAWYKNQQNIPLKITSQSQVDKSCDLNYNECSSLIENTGQITFSMMPRPIPLVSKLSLTVKTNLKNIKQIMIDFKGIDMEMGPNLVILKQNNDGDFVGEGMLPVCIRQSMNWKALVYVDTSSGLYLAPYVFETRK
jgi:hypothetical protein